MVDIYAAGNEVEAQYIVSLLSDSDIMANYQKLDVSQFPGIGYGAGLIKITVSSEDSEAARELLTRARGDGAISDIGAFI